MGAVEMVFKRHGKEENILLQPNKSEERKKRRRKDALFFIIKGRHGMKRKMKRTRASPHRCGKEEDVFK